MGNPDLMKTIIPEAPKEMDAGMEARVAEFVKDTNQNAIRALAGDIEAALHNRLFNIAAELQHFAPEEAAMMMKINSLISELIQKLREKAGS